MSDEEWYRPDSAIECPKCDHLMNDYDGKKLRQGWSGCTEHYQLKCPKCGFVGWVPNRKECGINAD